MFGWSMKPPAGLGVAAGRLAACPASPNCVCSQSSVGDARHTVAPFRIVGDAHAAWERLVNLLAQQPRTQITARTPTYLHAECATRLRFIDDIEFLLDAAAGLIHVRSASRLGRSDLGHNRRRVEQLRGLFEAAG